MQTTILKTRLLELSKDLDRERYALDMELCQDMAMDAARIRDPRQCRAALAKLEAEMVRAGLARADMERIAAGFREDRRDLRALGMLT